MNSEFTQAQSGWHQSMARLCQRADYDLLRSWQLGDDKLSEYAGYELSHRRCLDDPDTPLHLRREAQIRESARALQIQLSLEHDVYYDIKSLRARVFTDHGRLDNLAVEVAGENFVPSKEDIVEFFEDEDPYEYLDLDDESLIRHFGFEHAEGEDESEWSRARSRHESAIWEAIRERMLEAVGLFAQA